MNQVHHKSRLQCSFECLEQTNCYFFDECKVGSSISCYFYDNNVANSSDDENGRCIRYALVSGSLFPQFPDPKIILILKMITSFKQLSVLLNFENQPYGFIFINFYNHEIFYTILLKEIH